ncbi:MAG: hypothetical protein IT306_09110 [Chloroflexi bacterium]|nr:hypothetical protein [Chloroflexota bacterium]
MQRRQICERAVFDRTSDDPRVLVYRYQQQMRAQLLDKAVQEARREAWLTDFFGMLASASRELAHAIVNPEQVPQRVMPAGGLRLVPTAQVSF